RCKRESSFGAARWSSRPSQRLQPRRPLLRESGRAIRARGGPGGDRWPRSARNKKGIARRVVAYAWPKLDETPTASASNPGVGGHGSLRRTTAGGPTLDIRGRVAVVTGGGGGIGGALSRALVAGGAKVLITDLDGPAASKVADTIRRERLGTAIAAQADASS